MGLSIAKAVGSHLVVVTEGFEQLSERSVVMFLETVQASLDTFS
jgi:hypothetical protein